MSDDATIQHLVWRVQEGDTEALAALYDRYAGQIYAFLRRVVDAQLAEELLQDIFVLLWQKASLYDPSRGSFNAWFFTLARRRLFDALPRYTKHRAEVPLAVNTGEYGGDELSDSGVDIEAQTLRRFRDDELRQAMQLLPPDQRQVLMLTYFGGLSQRELADMLNLPISTIKGRARMGLQRLRQVLPENDR